MSKLSDFVEYKKHQPEYKEWKENRDNQLAKKVSYVKSNPIPDDEFKKDVERAKIVLNAVNVMDEYSQTKTEDTEIVTNLISGQIQFYLTFIGMGLATFLATKFPPLSRILDKHLPNQKLNFSLIVGGIISGLASIPIVSLATKAKIGAARQGRFEAMKNELNNEKIFAQLTDKQKEKVLIDSKDIELSKKELYSLQKNNLNTNLFSFVSTINNLIKNKKIYENERQNFEKTLCILSRFRFRC